MRGGTADFQTYDTYYIIALPHFFWGCSILLLTGWLIYKLTSRWLYSARLSLIHIVLTILALLIMLIAATWFATSSVALAALPSIRVVRNDPDEVVSS